MVGSVDERTSPKGQIGMSKDSTNGSKEGTVDEGTRSSNPVAEEAAVEDHTPETHHDVVDLEIGEIFELLKNERRRRVIEYLKTQEDSSTSLSRLAKHIAALENDVDEGQVSSAQRKRTYISLYQNHLPKLDDYGVIEYHQNRGTAELRETTQLDPYIEVGEPEVDHRLDVYIALSVGGIVGLGILGAGPFGRVPYEAWTVLSLGALIGLAGYRYYRSSP